MDELVLVNINRDHDADMRYDIDIAINDARNIIFRDYIDKPSAEEQDIILKAEADRFYNYIKEKYNISDNLGSES